LGVLAFSFWGHEGSWFWGVWLSAFGTPAEGGFWGSKILYLGSGQKLEGFWLSVFGVLEEAGFGGFGFELLGSWRKLGLGGVGFNVWEVACHQLLAAWNYTFICLCTIIPEPVVRMDKLKVND